MWRLSKAHALVLEWRCQEETSRRAAVAMALRHVQALHKYASLKCVGNSSWLASTGRGRAAHLICSWSDRRQAYPARPCLRKTALADRSATWCGGPCRAARTLCRMSWWLQRWCRPRASLMSSQLRVRHSVLASSKSPRQSMSARYQHITADALTVMIAKSARADCHIPHSQHDAHHMRRQCTPAR